MISGRSRGHVGQEQRNAPSECRRKTGIKQSAWANQITMDPLSPPVTDPQKCDERD